MVNTSIQHTGWRDENVLVQDARRSFNRRVRQVLQVEGMPAISDLPSERRMKAGIDTLGYYTYPLLFYTAFPNVSLSQLRSLSVCGSYLFDYILCFDRVLDHPSMCDAGITLLSGLLHREAMSILHQFFPPNNVFWTYYDSYYGHFSQAVLRERAYHHCLFRSYTEDDLQFIYSGKSAIAKACIAALALLDGSQERIATLSQSHDAFYVGFQIFDDLQDWRLDYQHRHYSYPLTLAFQHGRWQERIESEHRPEPDEVAALLQETGAVEQSLALVLAYLDKAERQLSDMLDGSWGAAIRHMRQRVRDFRFGADSHSPAGSIPAGSAARGSDSAATPAIPIAYEWLNWLDHARVPLLDDQRLIATQQQYLELAGGAVSLGDALSRVGLAIAASLALYPDCSLAAHLGMTRGELDWCQRNAAWLDAVLALCIDSPAYGWTPGDAAIQQRVPGWMPPAVGRYLGYRLVEEYRSSTADGSTQTPAAVLDHYRQQFGT